ncbi:hypothetical protein Aeqsu_1566 [Aequorivita sublithincola DSM 14238]|uniref:DUF4271 domain-containing protein n=1 Tax=Aequorivita sublithincola (strain DSM 14238 / LMG 21431 / ACAM 643 / 9-3) TaxID=746697 RepID=I3YVN3_AEQSU|nr:DUF4271 domain-containing protein [Aequorivita sublithincola]AFL81051.1 hypothetical protein Aeqsu_1566 [Aequorivita sublithincola DSM 14238]
MDFSERLINSTDWATYLLVGCFVLYALSKYYYPKRFHEFSLLPITNQYFFVHGKNDELNHPFNMMLFVAQLICVSVFVFLVFEVFNPMEVQKNEWLFLQIFTGYGIFILMKFSLEKIIANIFSLDEIINNYLYQKLSYRNFLGIIFFIGNLFFLFIYPPTTVSLVVFAGFALALNTIALLYSYKKNGNLIFRNFFYFILYLCALEIAPYIILYKTLF